MREIIDIPPSNITAQLVERTPTDKGLDDLTRSIRQIGIIEPLVVIKSKTGYALQAGKRRLMVAKRLGLPTVPCIVIDTDQITGLSITLHENFYRENLNPVDEALIFKELRDKHRYNTTEISTMLGQSAAYVSQRLQIIEWPDNLIEALASDKIGWAVARELAMITDDKHRNWLLKHAISSGANYRLVRQWRLDYQTQPIEERPQHDYNSSPPTDKPVAPLHAFCWWCERDTPMEHLISLRLCHQCFGALQLNKDQSSTETRQLPKDSKG